MRITDLFLLLRIPLALMVASALASTLAVRLPGLELGPLTRVAHELDVWQEGTVGTWLASLFFLLASLSFVPLGWGRGMRERLGKMHQAVLRLAAIALFVLSADEAARIHERLGVLARRSGAFEGTALDAKGFSWIVLYAPVVLLGAAALAYALSRLTAEVRQRRGLVRVLLVGALAGGPLVLLCEWGEARLWAVQTGETLLGVLEESLEVLTLVCVMTLNTMLALDHESRRDGQASLEDPVASTLET